MYTQQIIILSPYFGTFCHITHGMPSWPCGDGRCACDLMALDIGRDRGLK